MKGGFCYGPRPPDPTPQQLSGTKGGGTQKQQGPEAPSSTHPAAPPTHSSRLDLPVCGQGRAGA